MNKRNVIIAIIAILVIIIIIIGIYFAFFSSAFASAPASAPTSAPASISSPLSSGVGPAAQLITAKGCDFSKVNVGCPLGQNMSMISAFYGRRNTTACPGANTTTAGPCSSASVGSTLSSYLNGKNNAVINVLPSSLGGNLSDDPCPGTTKEFEVDYTCS